MTFEKRKPNKHSIANRKMVQGVGINDADYMTQYRDGDKKIRCLIYHKWTAMLERCYSKKFKQSNPSYAGSTVSKEWLRFSNFKLWMESQDWKGKELDKDVLVPGNKLYSPETCVFVSKKINNLLKTKEASRGKFPIGVSFDAESSKFKAECNVDGKSKNLGRFKTIEKASSAYKGFKRNLILLVAGNQENKDIKNGLIRHSNLYI